MKILLTGGSGFIGSEILKLNGEYEIMTIGRRKLDVRGKANSHHVRCSLSDIDQWLGEAKSFRPDAVMNLAWQGLPDYSLAMCRENIDMHLRFRK